MRLAMLALVLVGCAPPNETAPSSALSRSWAIELGGVCTGAMTTSQTDTTDKSGAPYGTYYDGQWSCGTMSGPITGALDARTKHFALNLFFGAKGIGADGFLGVDGMTGTAIMERGTVPFSAK